MYRAGIVEHSMSMWNSPAMVVPKGAKKWRFVLDYRGVNNELKQVEWPLLTFDAILMAIGAAKANYFLSMDLIAGFHQIPLDEESREMTAFTVGHQKYQYRRMPMGTSVSPAEFQKRMAYMLGDMFGEEALPYVDDILGFARTPEELVEVFHKILYRARQAGIKLHPDKLSFLSKNFEFLGHYVSAGRVHIDGKKVEAINAMPRPATVNQLRRFLGMTNYQRSYIKDYAKITTPLTRLLRKKEGCLLYTSDAADD